MLSIKLWVVCQTVVLNIFAKPHLLFNFRSIFKVIYFFFYKHVFLFL